MIIYRYEYIGSIIQIISNNSSLNVSKKNRINAIKIIHANVKDSALQ